MSEQGNATVREFMILWGSQNYRDTRSVVEVVRRTKTQVVVRDGDKERRFMVSNGREVGGWEWAMTRVTVPRDGEIAQRQRRQHAGGHRDAHQVRARWSVPVQRRVSRAVLALSGDDPVLPPLDAPAGDGRDGDRGGCDEGGAVTAALQRGVGANTASVP